MLLIIETCLSCAILGASSWVWAYAANGISRSAVLGALPGRLWPPPNTKSLPGRVQDLSRGTPLSPLKVFSPMETVKPCVTRLEGKAALFRVPGAR
jgi:hypothetical protein